MRTVVGGCKWTDGEEARAEELTVGIPVYLLTRAWGPVTMRRMALWFVSGDARRNRCLPTPRMHARIALQRKVRGPAALESEEPPSVIIGNHRPQYPEYPRDRWGPHSSFGAVLAWRLGVLAGCAIKKLHLWNWVHRRTCVGPLAKRMILPSPAWKFAAPSEENTNCFK